MLVHTGLKREGTVPAFGPNVARMCYGILKPGSKHRGAQGDIGRFGLREGREVVRDDSLRSWGRCRRERHGRRAADPGHQIGDMPTSIAP